MCDKEELKKMIMNFRLSELQVLLGFAGRNKSGKKSELQARALELLNLNSVPVQMKIRELQKLRYPAKSALGNNPPSVYNVPQPATNTNVSVNPHPTSQIPPGGNILPPQAKVDYPHSKSIIPNIPQAYDVPSYPVHPDVRFKPLPFYDIQGELLKPASLMPSKPGRFQESVFFFHLTPQQAHDVAMSRGNKEYGVQVQLRFCLLETTCEQDDNFPPSICVKVNSKVCPLPNPIPTNKPGVEPKRPSRPVNITGLCRLSPTCPNHINISWASEYGRGYVVGVYLVRRLSSGILLSRLKSSGVRNPDHTRALIKEKLQQDPDSEIATTSLRGSLMCPLGKMRMQVPSRATTCSHLQCFDASLYLQMNEKKPTWICPVCDKPALFKKLVIDGLFMELITKAPSECMEVQFHENGSWTPVLPKKSAQIIHNTVVQKSATISSPIPAKKRRTSEVIDLTVDSSSDEDDDYQPSVSRAQTITQPVKPASTLSVSSSNDVLSLLLPSHVTSSSHSLVSSVTSQQGSLSSSTSNGGMHRSQQYSNQLFQKSYSVENNSRPVTSTPSSTLVSMLTDTPSSNQPLTQSSNGYPNVSYINDYPPVSSPYPEYLTTSSEQMLSYQHYQDIYSMLHNSDSEQQMSVNSTWGSELSRQNSTTSPDVISLD
ncbi:E3 SUMO-protein ligase PIAS2-like isoform X2 [Limulus polyphemus]|uniref:E3 SUMO-protein ligase PIAS2-like isoform X2 n=1 Tax=Limulus polyphemus TaxID=6850 RepID=A0ABM1BMW9_LIMPO|nr:E3 SUMO-protein ligase PIAS2-like isoform X2 [Limulus polyphemus]